MVPLGTDRPLRGQTVVTWVLIVLTVGAFVAQLLLGWLTPEGREQVATLFALRPWEGAGGVVGDPRGSGFHWWTLLTYQFLHADWWHLAGNMLFLWVFGPNIEDRFGKLGFALFYLIGGAISGALHVALSHAGAIGASGAIAGCTGAYLVMFPRTTIRVFSLLIVVGMLMVPAWWFIGLSVVWDLVAQGSGERTGVAHLAHLAGYAFGATVSFGLLWAKVLPREPYDVFSMARQAYRRQQIKSAAAGQQRAMDRKWAKGKPVGTVSAVSNGKAAAEATRTAELAAARAEVSRLLSEGDLNAAGAAYKQLAERFEPVGGVTVLSRKNQYELASHFYLTEDHPAAVYAFERFLESYPKDAEAPQIRLLLGRINARYLNDPVRAKTLLTEAMAGLRDDGAREMARRELEALG